MKRRTFKKLFYAIILLTIYALSPISPANSQVATPVFPKYASTYNSPSDTIKKYPWYEYEQPAKGKFLVATSQLKNSVFAETVILLTEHNPLGTMGLIINQPAETKLFQMFPEMKESQKKNEGLYFGGPVYTTQLMMLIQSDSRPEESELVFDNIYLSNRKALLARMTYMPRKNEKFRVYAGYAGWRPGQLESEIARGSWYVVEADAEIIFDKTPHKIWKKLMMKKTSI